MTLTGCGMPQISLLNFNSTTKLIMDVTIGLPHVPRWLQIRWDNVELTFYNASGTLLIITLD
jgi:hypothetical protein